MRSTYYAMCVEAGAWDDVHCRAALHANVAACLRRDKKQEAAVAECDKALSLLYDPTLNCYYDPVSGKYYELNA